MSSIRLLLPAAAVLLATVSGCGSARLIHSDANGGVVAIPSNSNFWPLKYREEAEKLMASKCPNGYDIIEEREVKTGETRTQTQNTDRSPMNTPFGGVLERTSTSTTQSVSDQTEYRITYRVRKPAISQQAIMQTSATVPAGRSTLTPPPNPVPVAQ